jgi:hypothetical protein
MPIFSTDRDKPELKVFEVTRDVGISLYTLTGELLKSGIDLCVLTRFVVSKFAVSFRPLVSSKELASCVSKI